MAKPETYERELLTARKTKTPTRRCYLCEVEFIAAREQCPACGAWQVPSGMWPKPANNTTKDGSTALAAIKDATVLLSEVPETEVERILTGPWDHCFGGGLARTSVNLLGGAPGAGKSTSALQLADAIAMHYTLKSAPGEAPPASKHEVLYIGAEESAKEVKARAARLSLKFLEHIRLLPMGATQDLASVMLSRRPCAVIIDSLPGLVTDPEESVELCTRLKAYAIELNAPIIVIDHITKSDDFAGTMKLQHAVDALFTLYPEEGFPAYKELRVMSVVKNRFGPAQIDMYFDMTPTGLVFVSEGALAASLDDDNDDDG